MNLQEIQKRMKEINDQIATRGAEMTAEELDALEQEIDTLEQERSALIANNERRANLLNRVAGGDTGTLVRSFAGSEEQEQEPVDKFDTPQYRRAFMEYVCRRVEIPMELRADASTTMTDASAVVPTTIMNEIIKNAKAYGEIYPLLRKINIQGGVNVPILTLRPEAKWIGDNKTGEYQKIAAAESVSFSYFGLECKIAQSLFVNITTLDAFQAQFVELGTEAILEGIEKGTFSGNGTTQMLGILNDSRVPEKNVLTLTPSQFTSWAGWKRSVFAKMKKAYRKGMFFMAQGTFDGYIDGMEDKNGQPIGRVNYGIEGEEKYRFAGKNVMTVEDDILKSYDDAATGDVVAVFFNPEDYAINTNMQMRVDKWEDKDTNQVKNRLLMVLDGKLLDPNGVLIIKKGAAAANTATTEANGQTE